MRVATLNKRALMAASLLLLVACCTLYHFQGHADILPEDDDDDDGMPWYYRESRWPHVGFANRAEEERFRRLVDSLETVSEDTIQVV